MREEGVGREEEGCVHRLLPQGPVGEGGGVRPAIEQMGGCVWMGVAVRTGVGAGFANAVKVREQ